MKKKTNIVELGGAIEIKERIPKFVPKKGFTFDDVLLVPAKSNVLPAGVNLRTRLTKNIWINTPIVGAAMDTVTESKLAIAIASEGGIGIIHRAMPITKQADEVSKVKKSGSTIIYTPITLHPDDNICKAVDLMQTRGVSGFPVVVTKQLVGILTNRDIHSRHNKQLKVSDMMTQKNLITAKQDVSVDEAKKKMQDHKIEKLPIIDKKNNLVGLITLRDIKNIAKCPNASKDSLGRLLVGAAIGTGPDAMRRAAALIAAEVDVIAIDTAHGHSRKVLLLLKKLRKKYPALEIIAGNVATAEATTDLIKAGASAIKVGIGPGSICTTRIVAGAGVPQITAVDECSKAASDYNIPIIADGGIKVSGDITKALAAGASSVMIGSLFAGTEESPGELIDFRNGKYKRYRGMGSLSAMAAGSKDRYNQEKVENKKLVAEGVESMVPYKGLLSEIIHPLMGGLRSGMGYCGCKTIVELHEKAQFIEITAAGLRESHVHDVIVTEESPNFKSN